MNGNTNSVENFERFENLNETNLNDQMQKTVHRIEGLAMTLISEFQNFKHFVEEEESLMEEKMKEWKEHIQHFPEELSKKIYQV